MYFEYLMRNQSSFIGCMRFRLPYIFILIFRGTAIWLLVLARYLAFIFWRILIILIFLIVLRNFWRRWHISLGTWFRDYVYIPLGGNRVGKNRQLLNILVVWMLTGFWHGAAWNFIVWGLLFAVLLVIEKIWLLKYLTKCRLVAHSYVLFFVVLSFVIFNAENMYQAFSDIGGLFGVGGIPFISAEAVYCLRSFGLVLIIAMIGATPFIRNGVMQLSKQAMVCKFLNVLEPIFLFAMLLVMTAYLVDGSFNPFLYFRF